MAYTHQDQQSGQLIRAANWNEMSREIERLGSAKVNRLGGDTIQGPLKVTGLFSLQEGAAVNAISTDGSLNQNRDTALPTEQAVRSYVTTQSSTLTTRITEVSQRADALSSRLDVFKTNLVVEKTVIVATKNLVVGADGNVGIGTNDPKNKLQVEGNLHLNGNSLFLREGVTDQFDVVKWNRTTDRVEAGGFQGITLGHTKDSPNKVIPVVHFRQDLQAEFLGSLSVQDSLKFGAKTRQMINLWNAEYGIGIQSSTQYFRSYKNFAWFAQGSHSDGELEPGSGGTRIMYANTDRLEVNANIYAGNSALYFTKTDHNFSGIGDTVGYAAIENGANYNSLMILGRQTPNGRLVGLWDALTVYGTLSVTGPITPSAGSGENNGIMFPKNPGGGGGDAAWIRYWARTGESTTLEIGIGNDNDDVIHLRSSGGVAIFGSLTVQGVFWSQNKYFNIAHPLKAGMRLIHGCLEGPEHGVYYRGQGRLIDGKAIIVLPDYFEALTREEQRTVQLTPKGSRPYLLSSSEVVDGAFTVYGEHPEGAFDWEVKADRKDVDPIQVEIEG